MRKLNVEGGNIAECPNAAWWINGGAKPLNDPGNLVASKLNGGKSRVTVLRQCPNVALGFADTNEDGSLILAQVRPNF